MLEGNITRLILLLASLIVLGIFLTIVFDPKLILKLYSDILGQQLDAQKSSEVIKVVGMHGLR